ncbi:MAG: hypothetical protein Q4B70_19525, partial [Lachnospiraceae bacterium]|nr:hypothetical protein [Lachnospiraceae bacterium]
SIVIWITTHKKQLVFWGLSVPTVIAIVLGIKNKDALKAWRSILQDEMKKADIYSTKWFDRATDAELDMERKKVQLDYCSSENDFKTACRLQKLLWRFDKEIRERAGGDEVPYAPSIPRENGRYLPNDD